MTLICILVGLVLGVTIQGISLTPAYVALTLTYYLSLENTELTRRLPSLLAARYSKTKEELKHTHNAQWFFVCFLLQQKLKKLKDRFDKRFDGCLSNRQHTQYKHSI